nr:MAG TPA: repressor [Bacteriophage sp.]
MPKGRKAVIVAAATAAGQSVTEFISQAIEEKMGSGGQ